MLCINEPHTHIHTHSHILCNIYILSQVPSSLCSVPCTAGFRKNHQEETADCCFDCVQCPENEVSNETGTCLHAEVKLLNLNTTSSQPRHMIWPRWKQKS